MTAIHAAHRNRGARLTLVRLAGALVILASISIFVFGMVSFNSGMRLPCAAWHPVDQAWCIQRRQSLQQLGTSNDFLASFEVVGIFIEMAPWILLALLIFWRKSSGMYETLFSVALILFGTFALDNGLLVSATYFHPGLQPVVDLMSFLAIVCVSMWFVFPDGRFVPRWTRWVAAIWTVRALAEFLFPGSALEMRFGPVPIPALLVAVFVAALAYSILYRYRRGSDQTQRQQIKWVVVGGLVYALVAVARVFLDQGATPTGTLTEIVIGAIAFSMSFVFALCLGVAIFRYRLWNIDLIVSRTLVYLPLTAIVAGIFAASIALAQRFFLARTGSKSDIATAIAALVTVALFDPIKRAIQKTVDANFKEGRNPVARLKAFGDAVENELGVLGPHRVAQRLLDEAVRAYDARSRAVYLGNAGNERLIHTHGTWSGKAHLTVPLQANAIRLGRLELGERGHGAEYARRDEENLQRLSATIAQALAQALTQNETWAEE